MILTQTIRDLGLDFKNLVGAMIFDIDGPTGHGGFGEGGIEAALEKAAKHVIEKHGPNSALVNAKIEQIASHSHPSYHVVRLRISGDIYIGIEIEDDD